MQVIDGYVCRGCGGKNQDETAICAGCGREHCWECGSPPEKICDDCEMYVDEIIPEGG